MEKDEDQRPDFYKVLNEQVGLPVPVVQVPVQVQVHNIQVQIPVPIFCTNYGHRVTCNK